MKYEIRIKAEKDPIEVDAEVGNKLSKSWEDFKVKNAKDRIIQVDGWQGMLSEIRSFKKVESRRSEKEISPHIAEYNKDHAQIRKLSPEDRAKKVGLFKLFHWANTGRNLEDEPLEFKKQVYARLIKFYKENPKRVTFDLKDFKDLYDQKEKLNTYRLRAFDIVGETIHSDIIHSQYV